MVFDQDYYFSGNYWGWYENPERALRMKALWKFFIQWALKETASIVDFWSATWLLIEGIKMHSGVIVHGMDISDYAIDAMQRKWISALYANKSNLEKINPECIIALDVFEHMQDHSIKDVLDSADPQKLVIRVPVKARDQDTSYVLECSNNDITHINCKTALGWKTFFRNQWFQLLWEFSEPWLIYSSEWVFTWLLKRN